MKLYLSSYRLGNNAKQLVEMVGRNKRAAIIINALDFSMDTKRKKATTTREIKDLENLGFQPEVLDLKKYFGNFDKLKKDLSRFGLLWVIGGNVFLLRKAMKLSGIDKWLLERKNDESLVYAGYSAGVCVLSPSLKGMEIVDDPKVKARGYNDTTIWQGIGIISCAFAPHYKSDHPESEKVDKEIEYYIENKIPFRALRDGEVIIESSSV